MAIGKSLVDFDVGAFEGGCNYDKDITALARNESPNSVNVVFDGERIYKRPGWSPINASPPSATQIYSLFDFGVEGAGRKLLVHLNDKVYKMDGLDGTLDLIRSSVSQTTSYNASVKQRIVQTYDNNAAEYYWDGAAATMSRLSTSAPGFKHVIEDQGYLLGGNIIGERLRIYYEDINTMVDGDYDDFFTLTGSRDDSLSGFVSINGRTYAFTKERVFRLSFVGGVAVWDFREVVSSTGAVPRTMVVVVTREFGEVALFLGYDRHMYIFNGTFVHKIDEKFYESNNDTPIALDQIDQNRIEDCSAVYDREEDVYRLMVVRKSDTENKYMLNINVQTLAYYPFTGLEFASLAVAQNNIGRRFLLGAGYDGVIAKLFTDINHDNGKEIVEFYESPPITARESNRQRADSVQTLFRPVAKYKLRYSDRTDYDKTWARRPDLEMYHTKDRFLGLSAALGTTAVLGSEVEMLDHLLNLPVTFNSYRFRLETGGIEGQYVSYTAGTVAGTAGGTSLVGTGTAWASYMTAANNFRVWIKSGIHKNKIYTFDYVSATSATVGTLDGSSPGDDFAGADYEVFRINYAPGARRWELNAFLFNADVYNVGRTIRSG